MALSAMPAAQGASVPSAPTAGTIVGSALAPIANHVSAPAATQATASKEVPRPASNSSGDVSFYANASVNSGVPSTNQPCKVYNYTTYIYNYCYNWTYNPTLVPLGGSNFGVSYEVTGNTLGGACASYKHNFTRMVAFARSTDNGSSWGAPVYLGNSTCGAYSNAIEPSFASTGGGSTVYGVFVEDNESFGAYATPGILSTRSPSALGFVKSTNGGATFSTTVTLPSKSFVGHPVIAAVGKTIYVVWENESNSTTSYVSAGGPYYTPSINPVAIEFMASTNGGSTWTTPKILPGFNSTAYYLSLSPSIALNATGTLAVSYFSNLSCLWYTYSCLTYGMDLLVVTSSNNGTSWSTPSVVAPHVGMNNDYGLFYWTSLYQEPPVSWVPQSQVTFSPSGSDILIAYDGTFDSPLTYNPTYWYYTGVFFASGPSSGAGPWTNQIIAEDNISAISTSFDLPTVGESSGGTIYYAFQEINDTYCYGTTCPRNAGADVERLVTSTDGGATWSSPAALNFARYSSYYSNPYYFDNDYQGYLASVAFTTSGSPLIAYPSPGGYSFSSYYNGVAYVYTYQYSTHVLVATIYSGATVQVTFQESGLLSPNWKFNIAGTTISVVGSTNYTVLNVPDGISVSIATVSAGTSYGQETVATDSVGTAAIFTTNSTVYVNYSVSWQLQVSFAPYVHPNAYVYWDYAGQFYEVYGETYCYGVPPAATCYTNPDYHYPSGYPWYFPNGTVLDLGSSGSGGISFWNGTGAGSSGGLGTQVNVTMIHYINETGWAGGFGIYDEQFNAHGLPATSVYHYTFNGSTHSAPATETSYARGIYTGTYAVSNIWANSSTAGYQYFGTPDTGSPVIVPSQPIVNFSFALVDLSSAMGTVSFHATGLTAGTVWHFAFNGTEYSSDTPYINVTTRDGTYPVAGYPVVAANATVGYTPTGLTSTLSVTTGSTYPVSFTNAYRVIAQAGNGGSISGTGHGTLWLASGSSASFHAIANANYLFGGWTGTGVGSYSGNSTYANVTVSAAMTEVASFYPTNANRFNLTFHETGLAPGTWWTVYLGGKGYSTQNPLLQIGNLFPCGPSGTYNLSVPYAYVNGSELTRYAPGAYSKTTCTNGLTVDNLVFAPQYFVTVQSTAGGIGELTIGTSTTTVSTWVANQSSVELSESADTGYSFLGWNGTGIGSYTGSSPNQGIVVSNPLTEIAAFGIPIKPAPPRFWLNLSVTTALAPGTAWAVTVAGTAYASTTSSINVTSLLASSGSGYSLSVLGAYSPDGLTRYSPLSPPASVPVTHNSTVKLTYSTSYWVTVSAGAGGTVSAPASPAGWYQSGAQLSLSATPGSGYVFLGWAGTGTSAYSGAGENQSIVVKSPVTEVASFGLAPPPAKIVSQTSVWQSSTAWIGLAAIGLVVGALVGLLVGRRRSGGNGGSSDGSGGTPPPSYVEAPPEGSQ